MSDKIKEADEKEEKKPIIVRNSTDLQRLKLEKLMKNPDKPVVIPEKPKEKGVPTVPDFVRNVMGSSAGAGSGEFHVYRHLRRKEYARQKYMKEKAEKEKLEEEYHTKLEENKRKADEKTAKKRQKRLKKKQKQKLKAKKTKSDNQQTSSEASVNSSSEAESVQESKTENNGKEAKNSCTSVSVEKENDENSKQKFSNPEKTNEAQSQSEENTKLTERTLSSDSVLA